MDKITADNIVSPKLLRLVHLAMALLIFYSVANRVIYSWNREIPALFFFTVQSNLFCAIYWLITSIWPRWRSQSICYLLTTYIALTGIIFILLLDSGFITTIYTRLDRGEISSIVHYYSMVCSVITHYLIPFLAVVDFVAFNPVAKLRRQWWVFIYPLAYFVFATIYGQLSGHYIYPFLDPDFVGGWLSVAMISLGLLFAILLIHRGLYRLNKRLHARIEAYLQQLLQ